MNVYQAKRVVSPSPAIPDHLAGIESQSLGAFTTRQSGRNPLIEESHFSFHLVIHQ